MPEFTFAVNPHWARLPHTTAVLNARVVRPYDVESYRTTLSIKWVPRGAAWYETPHGRYLVTPDTFLVLNHDQEYAMHVDGDSGTETLCPFFQRGFVECVPSASLDDPEAPGAPFELVERLYPATGDAARILGQLRDGMHRGAVDATWLEDRMYALAQSVVALRDGVRREIDTMPAVRATTRAELYRRLHRGRDFLWSSYAERVSVARAARVACMAPHHFQRMFRAAFGESPMQFLQRRRLEVAQRLLRTTGDDITAICHRAGFESPGSFSWLFRQRFGVSPREYRRG